MKTNVFLKAKHFIMSRSGAALITAMAMLLATPVQADNVSQKPLSLSVGVPPNIIFTLDESGSMSWGHVPDANTQTYRELIGNGGNNTNTKRYRAANTNPMAYNPNVIYQIPPAYNKDGTPLTLSTSFSRAKLNGFETSNTANQGTRDLSSNYRVIKEHRIPRGTLSYAGHHSNDVNSFRCTITNFNNNGTRTCTSKNGAHENFTVTFEVTRTASRYSAILKLGDSSFPAATTRNGSTVTAYYTVPQTGPAHYYEFDGTLAEGQCESRKNNINAGGEACYRARLVDETAVYDKDGNRLKHPDKSNKRYPEADGDYVDGRSNFAIWYSFYRSRALATLSAASIAFDDLTPNVRFAWQSLNTCDLEGNRSGGTRCGDNSLKPYSSKHKGEFYTWLRGLYFNVGTPLHAAMNRAGQFLSKQKAYYEFPERNSQGEMYACRASYHVLMTDGMWNENYNVPNGKKDHQNFNLPGGQRYEGQRPFYDGTNNTLADLAMHYWATDLQPSLENKVPPHIPYRNEDKNKEFWDPRNNPATWQHMSNFILGLGLTNALSDPNIPWEGGTFSGVGYERLKSGAVDWPKAQRDHQNNVYDLWHAAINSRGEFYSVDDPDAMVQAFKDILDRIAEREATAAKPGLSSSMSPVDDPLGDGEHERLERYFYHTTYDSAGWTGDLRKTKLVRECVLEEIEGSNPSDPESTLVCEEVSTDGWRASDKLPSHDKRNIRVARGNTLVEFKQSTLPDVFREALSKQPPGRKGNQTSTLAEHVNYLRGDQSLETSKPDMFRPRNSVLGDMLGSSPAFVKGPKYITQVANRIDPGYENLVNKAESRAPMIYVGANDGMLHAFNADTGEETFAFIPTAVSDKLLELLNPNYGHRYYVDGSPVVADAYNGSEWRTILVGTLGAGGKGLFALDVTEPDNISLLWELNEDDLPGDVKLGYSFPEPTVARMHNGRWAVVTGNGYAASTAENGKAALLVIDAFTGQVKSLEVEGEKNMPNGLSTPRVVDLDGDGVADYAYAGDLQGNLWRFDLLGETAEKPNQGNPNGSFGGKNDGDGSTFKPSYGGKPLFVARNSSGERQPITAPPTAVRHPSGQGYIIIAGTGKYFEYNDDQSTAINTLYGVWDANTRGPSSSGDHRNISRENLQEQKVELQSVSQNVSTGQEREARTLSSHNVDWASPGDSNGKLGWFLDLRFSSARSGEMVIEEMRTLGNMLLFQTLLPNDDPCADGSTTWLYALNPVTGGATEHDPFGYNKVSGSVVSGISFGSEGGFALSQGEVDFSVHSGGEQERINPPPEAMGRQTWRIIHNP